jgi:hypothetical protein
MRERMMALTGSLGIHRGSDEKGLVLAAYLPFETSPFHGQITLG